MAIFYAFLGMLCWGLAPLFGKLGLYNVNPVTALSLRTLIAASLVMGWLIASRGFSQIIQIPPLLWLFISIEAILATLLGDLAYFAALKGGNINEVTLILSCSPLVTMLLSYFFLGEMATGCQIIGAALITIGLFFVCLD
ncbi:EamA family transporter [Desulfallas sp. Bu1-1]|jgi:transporter family protein|uniref:EamA family transporter n=1 Tax=Desulfallas sp. Bu1-1 TaxID=2787620 RepID=UPI00189EFF31|nr:EamA family transporter [Desulfallas sp. Bu1-1]MBF7081780.1 EamA family transporter [Desulfallas sp. Bu1-1]